MAELLNFSVITLSIATLVKQLSGTSDKIKENSSVGKVLSEGLKNLTAANFNVIDGIDRLNSKLSVLIEEFGTFSDIHTSSGISDDGDSEEEKLRAAAEYLEQSFDDRANRINDSQKNYQSTPLDAAMPAEEAEEAEAAGFGLAGIAAIAGGVAIALNKIVAAGFSFVEALAPAELRAYNQILRNLEATIGQSFEPMVQVATNALLKLQTVLLPLITSLTPVIKDISEAFVSLLMPVVKALVDALTPLLPVLDLLANLVLFLSEAALRPLGAIIALLSAALQPLAAVISLISSLFKGYSQIISAVMDGLDILVLVYKTVIQTLLDFVKSFFTFDLKGMFKGIADWIHAVIKQLVLFAASLALSLGLSDFVKNLIENLQPSGAAAAAGPTSIKSFEQISSDMANSAFAAAGSTAASQDDWKQDLIQGLKDVKANPVFTSILESVNAIKNTLNVPETATNIAAGAGLGAIGATRALFGF